MDKKRILVIEDNPLNQELLSDVLQFLGYEVISAETAEVGIEFARTLRPDLILMDIGLPGLSGLEATKILKNDESVRDIPIIALTAHAMPGDEEEALASGCEGYLPKPIEIKQLQIVLTHLLKT